MIRKLNFQIFYKILCFSVILLVSILPLISYFFGTEGKVSTIVPGLVGTSDENGCIGHKNNTDS